jgi:hypothetical protein
VLIESTAVRVHAHGLWALPVIPLGFILAGANVADIDQARPLVLYCGLDVSTTFLDVDGLDKPARFANTAGGLALLLEALPAGAHLRETLI